MAYMETKRVSKVLREIGASVQVPHGEPLGLISIVLIVTHFLQVKIEKGFESWGSHRL